MSPSPAPPLTVALLAQALYAEYVAGGDLSKRPAIEDAWEAAGLEGQQASWLRKAARVIAWGAALAILPDEEGMS